MWILFHFCNINVYFFCTIIILCFYVLQFHQFQDNKKPIVLMQMLIANFRERQCSDSKFKSLLKMSNYEWQFEVLVYHLMLRLIRTSRSKGTDHLVLVVICDM